MFCTVVERPRDRSRERGDRRGKTILYLIIYSFSYSLKFKHYYYNLYFKYIFMMGISCNISFLSGWFADRGERDRGGRRDYEPRLERSDREDRGRDRGDRYSRRSRSPDRSRVAAGRYKNSFMKGFSYYFVFEWWLYWLPGIFPQIAIEGAFCHMAVYFFSKNRRLETRQFLATSVFIHAKKIIQLIVNKLW